ncbi:MAG: cupin domain-containing protein [Actinomycetes bacterium]
MTEHARAHPVTRVDKPWGHEEIFALVEGAYCGKTIHITAGHSLSLQYHEAKEETVAVQSGRVAMEIGPDASDLTWIEVGPGEAVHVPPRAVHRMTAITDAVVLEASTAGEGWREDVVRLEDRYGRQGTSAP